MVLEDDIYIHKYELYLDDFGKLPTSLDFYLNPNPQVVLRILKDLTEIKNHEIYVKKFGKSVSFKIEDLRICKKYTFLGSDRSLTKLVTRFAHNI